MTVLVSSRESEYRNVKRNELLNNRLEYSSWNFQASGTGLGETCEFNWLNGLGEPPSWVPRGVDFRCFFRRKPAPISLSRWPSQPP